MSEWARAYQHHLQQARSRPRETGSDILAADLIAAGLCSPQCLLATENPRHAEECTCRCHGQYHGALRQAVLPPGSITPKPWYAMNTGYSGSTLDEFCPIAANGSTREVNLRYRAAKQTREPFTFTYRRNGTWNMIADWPVGSETSRAVNWAAPVYLELILNLLRLDRLKQGVGGPPAYFEAQGVRTQAEAQVLGAIYIELIYDNPWGLAGCLIATQELLGKLPHNP